MLMNQPRLRFCDVDNGALPFANQRRSRLHLVLSAGHRAETGGVFGDSGFKKLIARLQSASNVAKDPSKLEALKKFVKTALESMGVSSKKTLDNESVQAFLRRLVCIVENMSLTPRQKIGLATLRRRLLVTPTGKKPCSTGLCTTWDDVLKNDPDCERLTEEDKDQMYMKQKDDDLFDMIWYWICFFFIWG